MGLSEDTVDRVLAMWSQWEAGPGERLGVNVVVLGERAFVQAPDYLRARLSDPPTELDTLVDRLGDDLTEVRGIARLAYADPNAFVAPASDAAVVRLEDSDPRVTRLGDNANAYEWLEASADEPADERRGIVEGRDLVAVGSLSLWDGGVGHIGVFTRSESHGRGLAGAVTTPLVTEALDRGLVAQWRSRIGNDASAAVADRLGSVALGHQMFVRVRPQPR